MNTIGNDFQGRRIVLTGATSVIGREIAMTVARHNAKLVLLGRNDVSLRNMLASLPPNDHQIVVTDLNNTGLIKDVLKPLLLELKPIYGFCHCAGVVHTRSLSMSKPEMIQKQLDVNVLAGIEIARLVTSREMAADSEGSVVFISSIYAHIGAAGQLGYCLSKGAINAAVRAMAVELAPRRIKANTVSPGFVRTDMTESQSKLSQEQMQNIIDKHPLGEGSASDIARAVLFLLSPDNKWITGTDVIVDGGYTAQ